MMRQPVLYVSHGGGPCFWMDLSHTFGEGAFDELRAYFETLLADLKEAPKAILMVTAHWEEDVATVSTAANPAMLFDYYGFPEHTYHLSYPAPGDPDLAHKVVQLLGEAGIEAATNQTRGFDHGVFVPMLIIDPETQIPVVMMSLRKDLDPAAHIAIGKALAPLRDEGVLMIGSGSSYHNLREFIGVAGREGSVRFDRWLTEAVTQEDAQLRNKLLEAWESAPAARMCHPREEHLLPLMVAAGAAQNDRGQQTLATSISGKALSCYGFGL